MLDHWLKLTTELEFVDLALSLALSLIQLTALYYSADRLSLRLLIQSLAYPFLGVASHLIGVYTAEVEQNILGEGEFFEVEGAAHILQWLTLCLFVRLAAVIPMLSALGIEPRDHNDSLLDMPYVHELSLEQLPAVVADSDDI